MTYGLLVQLMAKHCALQWNVRETYYLCKVVAILPYKNN